MRKIYCDRCGKEIKHEADVFNTRILDITNHCQFIMAENDICGKCAKDIAEYVKKQPNEPESKAKAETEAKTEEKRKAGRPKKEESIDSGKIHALIQAGWSLKDIAQEIGVSEAVIAKFVYKDHFKCSTFYR